MIEESNISLIETKNILVWSLGRDLGVLYTQASNWRYKIHLIGKPLHFDYCLTDVRVAYVYGV